MRSGCFRSIVHKLKARKGEKKERIKKRVLRDYPHAYVDYDDTDGSLFSKWSTDYDSQYLKAHNNQSSYFLKGMSGYFRAANAQLSSKYAKINATAYLASEYRYKSFVDNPKETLVIFISQSGETADTLAALKFVKKK